MRAVALSLFFLSIASADMPIIGGGSTFPAAPRRAAPGAVSAAPDRDVRLLMAVLLASATMEAKLDDLAAEVRRSGKGRIDPTPPGKARIEGYIPHPDSPPIPGITLVDIVSAPDPADYPPGTQVQVAIPRGPDGRPVPESELWPTDGSLYVPFGSRTAVTVEQRKRDLQKAGRLAEAFAGPPGGFAQPQAFVSQPMVAPPGFAPQGFLPQPAFAQPAFGPPFGGFPAGGFAPQGFPAGGGCPGGVCGRGG